jgi:ribosome-binding protein aMBF1 (putative translation factor)
VSAYCFLVSDSRFLRHLLSSWNAGNCPLLSHLPRSRNTVCEALTTEPHHGHDPKLPILRKAESNSGERSSGHRRCGACKATLPAMAERGEFDELENLRGLGHLLIALRIAQGLSQRELARRLDVHESQASRDERNEYFGITLERTIKILDALNVRLRTKVEVEPDGNGITRH